MSFNLLSVSEVERRCRPLLARDGDGAPLFDSDEEARTADEAEYVELLRSMRSRCGFLAFGESLERCIEADRALCAALHVSPPLLASSLRSVLLAFEAGASTAADASIVTRELSFDAVRSLLPSASGSSSSSSSSLLVTRIHSRGFQRSPFVNLDTDSPDSVWNVEYHVLNRSLAPGSLTLKIGGSLQFGALQHIADYDFFGGGGGAAALHAVREHGRPPIVNEYRLDPALVVAVLTGEWSDAARAAFADRLRVERLALLPQIAAARADLARANDAVAERRAALGSSDDEVAALELDEAVGEVLFAQQTLDFLQSVQLAQLDAALSQFSRESA